MPRWSRPWRRRHREDRAWESCLAAELDHSTRPRPGRARGCRGRCGRWVAVVGVPVVVVGEPVHRHQSSTVDNAFALGAGAGRDITCAFKPAWRTSMWRSIVAHSHTGHMRSSGTARIHIRQHQSVVRRRERLGYMGEGPFDLKPTMCALGLPSHRVQLFCSSQQRAISCALVPAAGTT